MTRIHTLDEVRSDKVATTGPASSFGDFYKNLPAATLCTVSLCSGMFLLQILLDLNLFHYTMNPWRILHLSEYHRIVSSVVFHGSLCHVACNILSMATIGSQLEKRVGTIYLGMTILWATLLTSCVQLVAALVMDWVFGYNRLMHQDVIGFSGILFHLCVLESRLCYYGPVVMHLPFGNCTVPSHVRPWAKLIVAQLFVPNVSFTGHLAGIVTGTLQLYGFLNPVMPSRACMERMEVSETWRGIFGWSLSRPNYVAVSSVDDYTWITLHQRPDMPIWIAKFIKNDFLSGLRHHNGKFRWFGRKQEGKFPESGGRTLRGASASSGRHATAAHVRAARLEAIERRRKLAY